MYEARLLMLVGLCVSLHSLQAAWPREGDARVFQDKVMADPDDQQEVDIHVDRVSEDEAWMKHAVAQHQVEDKDPWAVWELQLLQDNETGSGDIDNITDSPTTAEPTPGPDDLTYVDWIIIGVTCTAALCIIIGVCVYAVMEYRKSKKEAEKTKAQYLDIDIAATMETKPTSGEINDAYNDN